MDYFLNFFAYLGLVLPVHLCVFLFNHDPLYCSLCSAFVVSDSLASLIMLALAQYYKETVLKLNVFINPGDLAYSHLWYA